MRNVQPVHSRKSKAAESPAVDPFADKPKLPWVEKQSEKQVERTDIKSLEDQIIEIAGEDKLDPIGPISLPRFSRQPCGQHFRDAQQPIADAKASEDGEASEEAEDESALVGFEEKPPKAEQTEADGANADGGHGSGSEGESATDPTLTAGQRR